MFSGIVEAYGKVIGTLSNWMYSYILIILLVGAGIYFTVKTKGVQFRALKEAIKVVMEPKDDEKSISSFQALMVSTVQGGNREYCRNFHSSLHWRSRSYVLDVADRASGKRICVH